MHEELKAEQEAKNSFITVTTCWPHQRKKESNFSSLIVIKLNVAISWLNWWRRVRSRNSLESVFSSAFIYVFLAVNKHNVIDDQFWLLLAQFSTYNRPFERSFYYEPSWNWRCKEYLGCFNENKSKD